MISCVFEKKRDLDVSPSNFNGSLCEAGVNQNPVTQHHRESSPDRVEKVDFLQVELLFKALCSLLVDLFACWLDQLFTPAKIKFSDLVSTRVFCGFTVYTPVV